MKPLSERLTGLIAAVLTPTTASGEVALDLIEPLARQLTEDGVNGVFVGGTSGECHSFSCQERMDVAARWIDVARGTELKVVVHVGANALPDAEAMATHAEQTGADAIASMSPFFFKPQQVGALLSVLQAIGQAASSTPLYYYDIPSMTGVHLPMVELLQQGRQQIPTLRGLKYTNADFLQLQRCLQVEDGYFDILFGHDAVLAGGWTYGVRGAIGTTYNFMAPLYHELLEAFDRQDEVAVQSLQHASCEIIAELFELGFLPAVRSVMTRIGIDVGPPRLPLLPLSAAQEQQLEEMLQRRDFQQWRKRASR
jgi:N-acetylneuraminate lyase